MTRGRKRKFTEKSIEQYDHRGSERLNNPPVGLGEYDVEELVKKEYSYDPHLDPQLVWTGKAERTSFEVDTVSLHVHERIDPKTVIEAVRKKKGPQQTGLVGFFSQESENPPLRDAVQFYKHSHGWSNRLIAGDSLLVMNNLLEKEGMMGKVQMIYVDPPYGIKYGSNFQPFINKRSVVDGKDEDLTREPEMIKAFRDTWELGIHSYLSYMRDRIIIAKDLLTESGSIFVQISEENIHYVRELLNEVFGMGNFCGLIPFVKTSGQTTKILSPVCDYLLWYAKNKDQVKYNQIFIERSFDKESLASGNYQWVELLNGQRRRLIKKERDNPNVIPENCKVFAADNISSQTRGREAPPAFTFNGKEYNPPSSRGWSTSLNGLEQLKKVDRLIVLGNTLRYIRYFDDFPYQPLRGLWTDTSISGYSTDKVYVVQTNVKVIERCILMTTDPGDLILDPTCGGGTTAYAAEKWGRRWITCDTSRIAITLTKQRIITSFFDYYTLLNLNKGVQGGFKNNIISRITLKSIAKNEPPSIVELIDQPEIDNTKIRISGPFTVEAVPSISVRPLGDISIESEADESIAREGETIRQSDWRGELLKTGIRGKAGQRLEFSFIETIPSSENTRYLHAVGETKEKEPKRVAISFGPEYAPLEQRQVSRALEEASHLFPNPKMVIFAAFKFDPEAAKDIDEAKLPGVALLKAQMNADLLTEDLKKKRSSNESFWLIGQPDVQVIKLTGSDAGKIQVEVKGFDYYNTRTGEIESGGPKKIAMWMLDTDYDFRSLYPRQIFFPMAGNREGWSRLARNLKVEIDQDLIEQYRDTASLPFKPGEAIAVKIIDDRGIESLKVIRL